MSSGFGRQVVADLKRGGRVADEDHVNIATGPEVSLPPPYAPQQRQRVDRLSAFLLGVMLGATLGVGGTFLIMRNDDTAADSMNQVRESASDLSSEGSPSFEMQERCAVERRAIETAFEAFFADTGADATSFRDLLPGYLKGDPSEHWVLAAGSPPTITGVGECA